MTYILTMSNMIIRSDGVSIPQDLHNIDYQEYLTWVAAGNPPATVSLSEAQQHQISQLFGSYTLAITQPVTYQSQANITKQYQTDSQSINNLSSMLLAFQSTQTVPQGFYWVALDNTQVPFTYQDMQNLAATIGTQGFTSFSKLQSLKAQVITATTVAQVQTITW